MARVFRSSVIDAPAAAVWERVRDFNGLPDWHPAIASSEIEDGRPSDSVGCVRSFHLQDGGHIRERLLALSDADRSCTYSILEAPMPLSDYVATLSVTPITDGDRAYVQWTAEFACDPADEAGLVELVGDGVFQGGFDALRQQLAG
ncbi:MAG: SRPBCC family protein [Thermoleophilia bacterium]|nr:SRPBCC family protein [Thermoleophilia bacterium]